KITCLPCRSWARLWAVLNVPLKWRYVRPHGAGDRQEPTPDIANVGLAHFLRMSGNREFRDHPHQEVRNTSLCIRDEADRDILTWLKIKLKIIDSAGALGCGAVNNDRRRPSHRRRF